MKLQVSELQKIVNGPHAALVTCEAKFHQATANVADLIGKLEQSNRLIESMKIILDQCSDSFHLRHMKSSYDQKEACEQEPCAKIRKLAEKRKDEQPVFITYRGMTGCRVCARPPGGAGGCKVCEGH